jgi:hypothetical protein
MASLRVDGVYGMKWRALSGGFVASTAVIAVLLANPGGLMGEPVALAATSATTMHVLSWNVCGNVESPPAGECVNTESTTEVVKGIVSQLNKYDFLTGSGVHAVLFQEICYADVEAMRDRSDMSGWNFGFVGILDGSSKRQCHPDKNTGASRGQFGIAVGIDRSAAFERWHYNAYPEGNNGYGYYDVHQGLVCATASSVATTVCSTHLTPTPEDDNLAKSGHSTEYFRNIELQQAKGIPSRVGVSGRIVAGGDMNSPPPDNAEGKTIQPENPMIPLYDDYQECYEAQYGDRDGHGTYQDPVDGLIKLDYVFSTSRDSSGTVQGSQMSASDHRPLVATINFNAELLRGRDAGWSVRHR